MHREVALLTQFVAAIEAERACLTQGDPGALANLTEGKAALAVKLAAAEADRERVLAQSGFARGRAGVEAWLGSPGRRGDARHTWSRLLELAAKAQQENAINGQLIAAGLQQNQQALNALLGNAESADTYGANGQTSTVTGRRTLGSA